nr:hypothetical protein [Angustibacter aerolatus]
MSEDQTTPQDPTSQHEQPDTEGEQIAHPGVTSDMGEQPDHGEDSTAAATGSRASGP